MKVVFYIDFANMTSGGIYVYAKGVLTGLVKSEEIEKVYLVCDKQITGGLMTLANHPKIDCITYNGKSTWFKFRMMLSFLLINTAYIYKNEFKKYLPSFNPDRLRKWSFRFNPLRSLINHLDADIVHVPLNVSPVYGLNKPLIITVHDVQEMHFPQYFDSTERMRRAINFKIGIDEADKIVVWFDHVKQDIVTYFGKNTSQIDTCLPPVTEDWYEGIMPTTKEKLQKTYPLKNRYVFYPAVTWEHKNHIGLIKAIEQIKASYPDLELVCTGHQRDYFPIIQQYLDERHIDYVHFLGIVSEADLIGLYKQAEMVVFPSFYEGGGIPAFEAMKFGIPVLCSDIYPFRQSIRDERFLFDPYESSSICKLMERILSDESFRQSNIENSRKRMLELSASDKAEPFIQAYKSSIKNGMSKFV